MYKIVSTTTHSFLDLNRDKSSQDLLLEASELMSKLGTSEIPISKKAKDILSQARALIGQAILNSDTSTRSRSSSKTSTRSLGDRISMRDKNQYLYTYSWVTRSSDARSGNKNALWSKGNDFRTWAESLGKGLPAPNSALNCWEAISVLLFLNRALTKEAIVEAYQSASTNDTDAVTKLYGLDDTSCSFTCSSEDLQTRVEPGDVIVFHSNRYSQFAHVALVLDNFEKLWVASHWSLPKDRVLSLTPNRIFTCSKSHAIRKFEEKIDLQFERLLDRQKVLEDLVDRPEIAPQNSSQPFSYARSYAEVYDLFNYVREKKQNEYAEYQDIQPGFETEEKDMLNTLYDQSKLLLPIFENAIEKFKENEDVLGSIYTQLDIFDQDREYYYLLYELEYLANDTVKVSTKFRPFFEG